VRTFLLGIVSVAIRCAPRFIFDLALRLSESLRRLGSIGLLQKDLRTVDNYPDRRHLFREVKK
jgi:hypothetical protein